jgi:tRNA 2-selenouridine synthase
VLAQQGHQVLDLENLAQHRGSVLGRIPAQAQPSQKWFDSVLLVKLQTFDATKPIFIEAESNKIGRITLPLSLVSAMHNSACIVLETPIAIRIAGLIEDYSHYILNPDLLNLHLQSLIHFHSKEHIAQWIQYIQCRDYQNLVSELLTRHYDPSYLRATAKHYKLLGVAQKISINNITEFALRDITRQLA